MRVRPIRGRGTRRLRGMVLIAVLWLVVALSIIATSAVASVRQEAQLLGALRQQVEAGAQGDAALMLFLQQVYQRPEVTQRAVRVEVPYRGQTIVVESTPLNGYVDLNRAPPSLLLQLLRVAGGLAEAPAQAVVDAIVSYRLGTVQGSVRERFDAIEDLMRVPGMSEDLYARLAPLVTVDARGSGRVNPMAAPVPVLAVLAGGNIAAAQQFAQRREAGDGLQDLSGLSAEWIDNGAVRRLRIEAQVRLQDGRVARTIRWVELGGSASIREGLPWRTFHTHRDFVPVRPSNP